MTAFQKTVKYLAIALAIALIVGIISMFSGLISMLDKDSDTDSEDLQEVILDSTDFNNIDIEIEACSLEIKCSDEFKIFTDSDKITCKAKNDTLIITEKDKSLFKHEDRSIVVYLPIEFLASEVSIEGGAGKIAVDSLSCANLEFEMGAGSVVFTELSVSDSAKINGGVGSFDIKSGDINNIDIELGVGSANITAKIHDGKIESGIGDLILNLEGTSDDYTVKSESGIGDIIIDNTRIDGSATTGDGDNIIKISGGISSITVNFVSE